MLNARKFDKRYLKKGIIKNTEWKICIFIIRYRDIMKAAGFIKRINSIMNKFKEEEIRYNNLKLNKTYEDYILKAQISVYRYRKSI